MGACVTFRRLLLLSIATRARTRRVALVGAAVLVAACASTEIGSPNDYEPVELNRVYPYPSAEELAQQKTEVVLATHYTTELPKKIVGSSMTNVQQDLLRVLGEAGARVVDRSLDDLSSVRRELMAQKKRRRGADMDVNWVLISRISRFEHHAHYEPPSGLFKSEEELAAEPGTCTHTTEVEVDLKAMVLPTDDVARTTFTLKNTHEMEQDDFEESCPLDAARKQALMDETLEEALPCLSVPLKNQFAPRGYIEQHRVSSAGDTHIFKTSLGKRNGARPGLELSIFRVQYMTTRDGRQDRAEHRIGKALITDQVGPNYSWVAVNLGDLEQPILAGDLVRAVYEDSFAAGLGLGKCDDMLQVKREPR